ncbi:MAG: hypothetical protein HQK56_02895 [Deltaproteobacteria bacterium]|nr:hypothetical protein [Deltaproteobacteria bacterium]
MSNQIKEDILRERQVNPLNLKRPVNIPDDQVIPTGRKGREIIDQVYQLISKYITDEKELHRAMKLIRFQLIEMYNGNQCFGRSYTNCLVNLDLFDISKELFVLLCYFCFEDPYFPWKGNKKKNNGC